MVVWLASARELFAYVGQAVVYELRHEVVGCPVEGEASALSCRDQLHATEERELVVTAKSGPTTKRTTCPLPD